jgi:hypothetical protein
MKSLLPIIALFTALFSLCAEDPADRIELFYMPGSLHVKLPKDQTGSPNEKFYPLTPNRVSDCLPGKLYDVRAYFEERGAIFGKVGFAWYNPDSSLLAVRAASADVDFIEMSIGGCYCPPINVRLKGEVVVQSAAGGEIPPEHRLRWEISTQGGQAVTTSAVGSGALGYSCEIESILGPNKKYIDCRMSVKVTYDNREYSALLTTTIPLSKRHSLLVGTTPTGDEVRVQITPTLEEISPSSPLDDAPTKKRLIECLEHALRSQ